MCKLSEKTRVVVNRGTIVPFSLAVEGKNYPPVEKLIETVRSITQEVYEIDGPALVDQTGLPRTLNDPCPLEWAPVLCRNAVTGSGSLLGAM